MGKHHKHKRPNMQRPLRMETNLPIRVNDIGREWAVIDKKGKIILCPDLETAEEIRRYYERKRHAH